MKVFLSALFIVSGLMTAQAQAYPALDQISENTEAAFFPIPTTRAQPCRFWGTDMNVRGYTCTSYEFSIEIPDGGRLNTVLSQMERRIQALEQRIQELEAR